MTLKVTYSLAPIKHQLCHSICFCF